MGHHVIHLVAARIRQVPEKFSSDSLGPAPVPDRRMAALTPVATVLEAWLVIHHVPLHYHYLSQESPTD